MKTSSVLSLALFILFHHSLNAADWKYVGQVSIEGKKCDAFYDQLTKVNKKGGYVSVWVKLVSSDEIDSLIDAHNDTTAQLAAKKIGIYYIPPFILAQSDTTDMLLKAFGIIRVEIVVTIFPTKIKSNIHYEIDTKQRKVKILSLILYNDNGEGIVIPGESITEKEWTEIPPDTFAELMMTIISNY